ncbi:MAG: hypothetical protein P4L91_05635 [Burkholderiaceae bacterium]|nr:hypothetical protein [Burkholderiaceae bacterium]
MSDEGGKVISSVPPRPADGGVPRATATKRIQKEVGDSPGWLARFFGSGVFAKETFVGVVILASFCCGLLISWWVYSLSKDSAELVNALRGTWNIFVPLITLALGYAFGKWK